MDTLELDNLKNDLLSVGAQTQVHSNFLVVKKWNWDYLSCLNFQKKAQAFVQKNREYKIYIFCNHPHCFTLGRGNERDNTDLIDFDTRLEQNLAFPLHKIHRGGGITFHHPGQWIFYPIVAINNKYTLDDHMCWMLKSVKEVLRLDFALPGALATKKLMGVWYERKKLASIGVGLNRFVTEHGLALNIYYDQKMFEEVMKINPCGIKPTTYTALEKLVEVDGKLIDLFHQKYVQKFIL